MPTFTGLRSNEIFAGIYNMIISQQVFADNIKGTNSRLVDAARVDGSLYGDQKLYYATDALYSSPWGNDAEAANLLDLDRPEDPECQAIILDVFRQVRLTVDNYLSKRAWSTEGAFSEFNSVMLGWVRETKRIYDATLYNSFIGTEEGASNKKDLTIALSDYASVTDVEAKARLRAQRIGRDIANLMVDMTDVTIDFNDYKNTRSYDEDEIKIIWNAKYVNEITYLDLPTIFHKDGVVKKLTEYKLPARYFGTKITSTNISSFAASTPTTGKPIDSDDDTYVPGSNNANGTIRTLIEMRYEVASTSVDARAKLSKKDNKYYVHLFPGDEITAGLTVKAGGDFLPGEIYIEQGDVIGKVYTKLPPYMSAFEVGTSFFNPRSLTETHYLTWGHNTIEHLYNYPLITMKEN